MSKFSFLTADEVASPGERTVFLKTNLDKGTTSLPITVRVEQSGG